MRPVRLDAVARVARDVTTTDAMAGRQVTHYSIPAFDETGGPTREAGGGIGSAKTRVWGGEVLISKLNPRKPRVQIVSAVPHNDLAVCSGEFVALIPEAVNPGYLRYVLLSDNFRQRLEARVQSVTRSQQRVTPDDIAHAWIEVPKVPGDQAVAVAFLDAETARIDEAIARGAALRTLVHERTTSVREQLLASARVATPVPLRRIATVQTGLTLNAGLSPANAAERPYLRVANVQPGSLGLESVKRVVVTDDQIRRHSLMSGDVLVTEGGDRDKLGRGVVWRGEVPGALHQNHVFAVRPNLTMLLPEYLEMMLASAHARRYFESTANQTTNLASTNSTTVGAFPVPKPTVDEQRRITNEFAVVMRAHQDIRAAIDRQIALLRERRQALITATVTGKLQVPAATPRNAAG